MRNTIVFCSWISEIVLEWPHQGCSSDLSTGFLNFSVGIFPFKMFFRKCFEIAFFFSLWRRDSSGFGAAISDAVSRSSLALCNSACADRIVMAASRLLGVATAHVILLSFAAGHPKSYWSGCTKAATVICQQIFEV